MRGANFTDCTNVRLTAMFVKNCADWAISFVEDSGGTVFVQSTHGCTVTKTAMGSYKVTPTVPSGGSFTVFNATAGHPTDAIKRRVVQRSAGTGSITFQVIDDATGNPTYSEYVNFLIYDQP